MEARARDSAWTQGHEPSGGSRAAHSRPRGLLNHLIPNSDDEPFLAQIYAAPEDDAPRQVRAWKNHKLQDYAPAMELVPASWVPKVVVRPLDEDPWSIAGPPPQGFEEFRKAAKMPVELEWY